MRPGDLTTGSAKLHKAWKKLRGRWEATKLEWHDPVSRDFEEKYLAPLEAQIIVNLERMSTLAAMLASARQECDH